MTTTHDFTQVEEIELPEPQEQRAGIFHKDTDIQVSIDYMGTQRIFKLGESFKSNVTADRLCKENNVPKGGTEAVYTIRKFYSKGLVKTADCRVRIPTYDCFPHPCENKRIREKYPDRRVTLCKTERIELRKLHLLVPEQELADDDLIYSANLGLRGYNFAFEEPKSKAKSFYMLPDFTRPTVLDLFAGAGGMSTGFSNAGFNVRWMVEKDPQAIATLKANYPKGKHKRVFGERVENFLDKAMVGSGAYPTPDEGHHVHASSPCQGMCYCVHF